MATIKKREKKKRRDHHFLWTFAAYRVSTSRLRTGVLWEPFSDLESVEGLEEKT